MPNETLHHASSEGGRPKYLIVPTGSEKDVPAKQIIESLVVGEHMYAFRQGTHLRRYLAPGDWLCFYAASVGIVAYARVASVPEKMQHFAVADPERYPWVLSLRHVEAYTDDPVVLDAQLRSRLDAFRGRSPTTNWTWFVRRPRLLTQRDFFILTGQT